VVKSGIKNMDGTVWAPNWREAEFYLRGGSHVPRPLSFPPPPRKAGEPYRFYDAQTGDVAKEAKTGYVTAQQSTLKQIGKDCKFLQSGDLKNMEWHFFPSGQSSTLGADPKVLDAIKSCGPRKIKYFFHIP
jgi:hypothetical protein